MSMGFMRALNQTSFSSQMGSPVRSLSELAVWSDRQLTGEQHGRMFESQPHLICLWEQDGGACFWRSRDVFRQVAWIAVDGGAAEMG